MGLENTERLSKHYCMEQDMGKRGVSRRVFPNIRDCQKVLFSERERVREGVNE